MRATYNSLLIADTAIHTKVLPYVVQKRPIMLGSMTKPLSNFMEVPSLFDTDDENRATRKPLSLVVSTESLNKQVELSSASVTNATFTIPSGSHTSGHVSPSPSPTSKKWFPLSPSSSCSTTPSLSEVEDDSMEMSQELWDSNFGINRAPWDAASEDQKDNNDSFFFFVPSPVNESASETQHSMFHSSMFDDKDDDDDDDDEMKEDCWIEDDEHVIPAPSEEAVAYVEQMLKTVARETHQYQATNRISSRQIQFTLQTGLETIHEGRKYGYDDNSDCSFSCCSPSDEALGEFLLPDVLIDSGVDCLNPAPQFHDDRNVLPTKSTAVNDRDTIGFTPEQQAAYDCLQALAFFL